MNTLEKLKEITADLESDEMMAVDAQGKKYTLEQASKAGVNVTITSSKNSALVSFKNAFGIDLSDNKELNQLNKLLGAVTGGGSATGGKRKRLTDDEKRELIKDWHDNQKKYANKADFSKKNNVSYQSFLQWEKQFGE
ncbi:hypothetical protein KIH41_07875 [Litoribacter ruber]|uniref:Uncharacterized protein n=1 Tax=Litoribacter ruber TaxID=702568 RepID=A0AAP2G340_9BACT|nr:MULTISPECIES: hypothetical protein [Litoribacter]MBS9522666.1 hypothetical protein [Litoribacter alkaliphilus]MBT0811195.1 hypothetical protein [Litoribacter ruber]